MPNIKELQDLSTQVRRDIIRMVHKAQSGHPGGPLGCADFLTVLYKEVMNYDAKNFTMDGKGEDIFFLSNGHLSAGWYSILARTGHFPVKELASFREIETRLQGHPTTAEGLPGVRIASGSLGMGLSNAIGTAQAKKLNNDDSLVYTLHGDGELQEGQIWEAAMYAAAYKVDNIIATIDYNKKQIDGPVDKVLDLGNLKEKWIAFGWETLEMDGNNIEDVLQVMHEAKNSVRKGRPVIILMKTEMGFGVDFMTGTHEWHGKAPNDKQAERALAQLEETLGDF